MSWDIALQVDGESVPVDHHEGEGGTYEVGGTDRAELNVTYNYSEVTKLVDFHFRDKLNGRLAGRTIALLRTVVERLGTVRSEDYWAPTPGNAGHAANILLGWARTYPEATWRVT